MYTGTLISDLMETVTKAEEKAAQQHVSYEQELHAIFTMQIAVTPGDQIYMGAA